MPQHGNQYMSGLTSRKTYGVSSSSLRRWANQGRIRTVRTPGNVRLYNSADIHVLLGCEKEVRTDRVDIAYARVSSQKQRTDLERQIQYLRERCPNHEIVTDVGSGVNFRRRGLLSVLERASKGAVGEVVVAHKDRLCRLAGDLLWWILEAYGVKVVVLNHANESDSDELAEDLIAVTTHFICKHHGRRKYTDRKTGKQGRAKQDQAREDGSFEASEERSEDPLEGNGTGACF